MKRGVRWLMIFFLLSFLSLAAGAVIFLIRFDPNRYRPYLEGQLSKALGFKVELGPIFFSWTEGPVLKVNEPRVRENPKGPPLFSADFLLLSLDSLSLLGGRLVGKARIEGGELDYRARAGKIPRDLKLRGIRTEVRRGIPGGRMEAAGEGRILSDSTSDLTWQGTFNPRNGEADFEIHFEEEKAAMKGEAFPFQKPPRFQANLELHELDLALLQAKGLLTGAASGEFKLAGAGQQGVEIRKSLQGQGAVEIRDGVFRNFNIVNAILRRVTVVPGLGEALVAGVPIYLQPLFNARDTPFELLQAEFVIREDQARFERLLLKGPQYLIEAEGVLSFEGEMNFRAKLILMEETSQFLVGRVNEFDALRNAKGRIVIPFVYRGTWPKVRPRPDLNFLAKKLFVEKSARLFEKGLEALAQGEKK